jgi:GNAT superfamily N-acetyltransferase
MAMHELAIRRAVAADAAELTAIARRAKADYGYPEEWLKQWEPELTITPAYIAANRVFVAARGGALLGLCAAEDRGASWTLEHVWVEPVHQGMGVGSALVKHALAEIRLVRPGMVQVASDPHATGFYEALGATTAGTAPAPMPGAPGRELILYKFKVSRG